MRTSPIVTSMLSAALLEQPSGGAEHVWQLWLLLIVTSLFAYVVGGTKWWPAGLVVAVLAIFFSVGLLQELNDPAIEAGLAIAMGKGYVTHSKIAALLVGVGPLAGLAIARRQQQQRVRTAA